MFKKQDENNISINSNLLADQEESITFSTTSIVAESDEKLPVKNDSSIEAENLRFTKHSPLVTLLIMSIGPLSNLISVLFDTLNMYLISKRFKNVENSHAVEILGFSSQFQVFVSLIGNYFGQVFITRVSSLIGSAERERAANLTSDLFKLSLFVLLEPLFNLVTHNAVFKLVYQKITLKLSTFRNFWLS